MKSPTEVGETNAYMAIDSESSYLRSDDPFMSYLINVVDTCEEMDFSESMCVTAIIAYLRVTQAYGLVDPYGRRAALD
jgi:hypothetical protein